MPQDVLVRQLYIIILPLYSSNQQDLQILIDMKSLKQLKVWKWIGLFLTNIPTTFRESLVWFLMTYSFPIFQIIIIWGIRQNNFEMSLDILNIILVTNASLYTAILLVINSENKEKKVIRILTIFCYVVTIVLFAISMVEITKNITIFPLSLYTKGTFFTLTFALLFGLISKYDEVKAQRLLTVKEGKEKTSTVVNGNTIQL